MTLALWFSIVGALLVGLALLGTRLRHLPLTTAQIYLGIGALFGAVGLLDGRATEAAEVLEITTEIAVIISLFTAGLKLRAPLTDWRWILPVRLAFGSMVLTVAGIAAIGVGLLGLPLGVAVLLGAVLAPTDPVLASEVQVSHPDDRDRLRFGLTGEAGLNDGTAFPFVMLGLGLIGAHELGPWGLRWLGVDVLWATAAGLALGWGLGYGAGKLVVHLRATQRDGSGVDDFLTLGLIALSYGAALLILSYGFLAVFAAGLALRRVERQANKERPLEEIEVAAQLSEDEAEAEQPRPETEGTRAAYTAEAVLGFNEKLESIGELTVMLIIGALLVQSPVSPSLLWLAPLLLFVVRPAAVWLGLLGARVRPVQRRLIAWFGIRGIGSLYYLAYALNHGLGERPEAELVTGLTLGVVAVSIVVHGLSSAPLLRHYTPDETRS